ncbi:MAG: hypothetical protein N3G76_00495 [Candidatus Micrarchaeota archaeon]|nr:hypothetical protein [Candidatus Micrarchaeota archaeon]
MQNLLLPIILLGILLAGCCGLSSKESASCPYGTYGETCTKVCNAVGGDNCFSQCIDRVRMEGLGDATTCCKETFISNCRNMCKQSAQYEEDLQECYVECSAVIASAGLPEDICNLPFL